MKKLLIIVLILQIIICLFLLFSVIVTQGKQNAVTTTVQDTVINRVQIDSIHILITKQESIINRINIKEKYEIEKAINSNDSDVVKLFKELVAE